ncbi:hypothetical protein EN925_07215 [Mesorhizobium sp. M7A.F.Ca.US.006.04.2.1]|uniref:hypothetical protein n=1 Tax=unclassified Mesorhizobium TaxID=325217 RepID=UPI000FCB823F|nr:MULTISPECIES: hypothetical protein [unclassified Mesorhizobium]RUX76909.1 hypothetical protein EN990_07750 [Mesorhizobium sp. M7A.F.Ca.US.005.03.1.1]RUY11727.1 hypothetical protein EN991_24825 [Mesorhizobium sp. M7A.F.Ca.US.005.03.2.1]RVA93970.1 hypothetical protein EN925_07215 [Mesorhizobium sp. M7A.F.Ca.US.006.04.2.1]
MSIGNGFTPQIEADGLPLSCLGVNNQADQILIAALAGREPISDVGYHNGRRDNVAAAVTRKPHQIWTYRFRGWQLSLE